MKLYSNQTKVLIKYQLYKLPIMIILRYAGTKYDPRVLAITITISSYSTNGLKPSVVNNRQIYKLLVTYAV